MTKKWHIKLFISLWAFCWVAVSQAHPWMFFREKHTEELLRVDSHLSYFLNGKATAFSGADLNYHNPMVDVNLGYTYSYLEKNHYFRLSELSVIFPFLWDNWDMSVGFKDILWSEADRYWNYGLWQARYLLDPLRPVQMGTSGVHFNYNTKESSFILSLSYFYLPDIIVYPELLNNRLYSKNPFFVYNIESKVKGIEPVFQLNKFLKPSVAFQFKHRINDFYVKLSYAYKGMNQLQKAATIGETNISELSTKSFSIDKVAYFSISHHLLSLEAEKKLFEKASLFVSFFYDNPEKNKVKDPWFSNDFSPQFTFSVLSYFQEKWSDKENTLFTIGYTKSFIKAIAKDPVTDDLKVLFNRIFDWKHAISASIEHENKHWFDGVLFRFRSNYALDNQYYQFVLENYIYLNPHFRFYLSGDLFVRFSEKKIYLNSSSIKLYKGLNRILIGGQYVF